MIIKKKLPIKKRKTRSDKKKPAPALKMSLKKKTPIVKQLANKRKAQRQITEKKKVIQGRPVIPIDWKRVEQLLMADCSGVQVAASIGISEDTLYSRVKKELGYESFTAYSLKFKEKGNSLLKAIQFESAVTEKNSSMQIWLGKQRLGQKNRFDVTSGDKPLRLGKDNPESYE